MANKILIVDDTQSVRDFITEILKDEQHDVTTASCGEEGVEICNRLKPDLVLLDIVMPGINGYETCRRIRTNPSLSFIKIIMISTRSHLNERLEGYNVGADDYIGKPFEKDELLAKVRVFLRLKSVEDQLQEMNDTLDQQVRLRTRQLVEAEKMAAIGRHTAGIVHNLNSPLGAFIATSELLTLKYPDEKLIMTQRRAAAQMTRIVKTILTTSQEERRQETPLLDMNEILRDQLELFNAIPFFKQEIQTDLALQPLPTYSGVYAHFSQTFANIIQNAMDAMHESKEKRLTISSEAAGNAILISISDTGHGLSEDALDKIFDPFFTTKPRAITDGRPSGTGLGLAYCMEIIKSYGGEISVDSHSGQGARFTVRLPMDNQQVT